MASNQVSAISKSCIYAKKNPSIALASSLCSVLTQKRMLDYSRNKTLPKSADCTYILNKQITCTTWTNFQVFLDICPEFPLKIIWRKIILKIKDLPFLSSQLFTTGQLLQGWPSLHFTPISLPILRLAYLGRRYIWQDFNFLKFLEKKKKMLRMEKSKT